MNTPALLRDAGCTAAEVKATGAFTRQQMEAGGFPLADAAQLRAGGFTCAEVRQEGLRVQSAEFIVAERQGKPTGLFLGRCAA